MLVLRVSSSKFEKISLKIIDECMYVVDLFFIVDALRVYPLCLKKKKLVRYSFVNSHKRRGRGSIVQISKLWLHPHLEARAD